MDLSERKYKIELAADNEHCVFIKIIRNGETISGTDEEREMAVVILHKAQRMLERTLTAYRQRKRDEQLPTVRKISDDAIALMKERNAVEELDGNLIQWYYDQYKAQDSTTRP